MRQQQSMETKPSPKGLSVTLWLEMTKELQQHRWSDKKSLKAACGTESKNHPLNMLGVSAFLSMLLPYEPGLKQCSSKINTQLGTIKSCSQTGDMYVYTSVVYT